MSKHIHTGSHDLPVTPALEAFMSEDWAEPAWLVTARDSIAPWAARRRAALADAFPGERLVVPSGRYLPRSNDQDYRFRPHTAHTWLTGNQTSDAVLVVDDGEALLYTRPAPSRDTDEFWRDRRYGDFWAGRRPTLEETSLALDLECRHIDELDVALHGSRPTRVLRGVDPEVDRLVRSGDSAADAMLACVLSELRLVKDDWEVAQLTEAVDATVRGFEDCVREWDQAVQHGERWIEGTFGRRARMDGNDVGYSSIVAAGAHATTLHWIDNSGPVRDGELILLDMGVEARSLYTADVTRTLPVSGRFTPTQRDLYSLVLRAQDAGIAVLKPGAEFRDFHRATSEVMAHGLADLGLLPCSAEEALDESSTIYRRWTLCASGHMLGMDVHDCGLARAERYLDGVLEEGHVLTVEPGLYLQAEDLKLPAELRGIGIRVEDDLVVTADGSRNLSAALPRDPDEIESWMADLAR